MAIKRLGPEGTPDAPGPRDTRGTSVRRRRRRIVLLLAVLYTAALPAVASDAAFSRALDEAGCSPASVRASVRENGVTAYEVTCIGNPVRKLAVFCTGNSCTAADARKGDEPLPEGKSGR